MLLAPMPSFDFALDQYQATLGFSAQQRESIAARVEGLTGFSRKEASLRTALSRLQQELLIIHDRDDRRIPFLHSRELSRPPWGAEYVETRNLGHQRLLTSAEVLDCAAGWLSRSADARGSAPSLAAE
jgi:pimeloyl-ACP methyl ester carboxylesterase